MATPVVYTDDVDGSVTWEVTDGEGQNLDWATPQIAVGDGAYQNAEWLGSAAPTREIRLPMPLALDLTAGIYGAYLKVPNGTDLALGSVAVRVRS